MTEESAHWLDYAGGDGGFRSDIDDGEDVRQGDELAGEDDNPHIIRVYPEDRYWEDIPAADEVTRHCSHCRRPVTRADERRGRCPWCGAVLLTLAG